MKSLITVVCALLSGVACCSVRTSWAGDMPDGQRWWSHVAVLADDKLEGRKDRKSVV